MMVDHIEENNVGSEGAISKKETRKAIAKMKSEEEAGRERNLDNKTQEDDNQSPWKEKDAKYATDATTVNNTLDDTGFTL